MSSGFWCLVCLVVICTRESGRSSVDAASIVYDSRTQSSSQLTAAENVDRKTTDNIIDDPQANLNQEEDSHQAKDELRCHCNLPVCVTTGYMCKSAMGTCFSEIVDRSDLSKSRHGCLELLSSDKSETCHNQPSKSRGHHHSNPAHRHLHPQKPLVLCCQDDLCNYGAQQVELRFNSVLLKGRNESQVGSEFQTVALETSRLFDAINVVGNAAGAGIAGIGGPVGGGVSGVSPVTSHKDLWLKAATIAVPIAGGFILVLLVLLAIRLLRRDRENSIESDYVPANRNDFQIRCVWGKTGQHQQPPRWKPMLLSSANQPIHQHQNIVYLPAVHKSLHQKPCGINSHGKKMWTTNKKQQHSVFPAPVVNHQAVPKNPPVQHV